MDFPEISWILHGEREGIQAGGPGPGGRDQYIKGCR